jgi:hypothetical protein
MLRGLEWMGTPPEGLAPANIHRVISGATLLLHVLQSHITHRENTVRGGAEPSCRAWRLQTSTGCSIPSHTLVTVVMGGETPSDH